MNAETVANEVWLAWRSLSDGVSEIGEVSFSGSKDLDDCSQRLCVLMRKCLKEIPQQNKKPYKEKLAVMERGLNAD